MTEQLYAIDHLTTERLRELFATCRSRGWVDYEYYKLMPEGITPPELSNEEILFNMDASNPHNYFVFMQGMEDEKDGIMIGFGLTEYPTFGAYLHLEERLLHEIVQKYRLKATEKGVKYIFNINNSKYVN